MESIATARPDGELLFEAVKALDLGALSRETQRGFDPFLRSAQGVHALSAAAEAGWVPGMQALLSAGAEIDAQDWNGATAALSASREGQLAALEFLRDHGAHLDLEDQDGVTCAMAASRAGHVKCLEILADAGADLNRASDGGITAAMMAALEGQASCLELLTDRSASLALRDGHGWSAIEWAAWATKEPGDDSGAWVKRVEALTERQVLNQCASLPRARRSARRV
jgi:ankyrin repeat protein